MPVITTSRKLRTFCEQLAKSPALFVDTEFIRDRTYWPKLCLIQVAGEDEAHAIDPLAPGMDLKPLLALLADRKILKVFHAARQDLEIFYHLTGTVPEPLFDTQVAAMVCGFGESVGYDKLVARFANARVDKTSQFTDWARRPLSERQVRYALDDVIHLRTVYHGLASQLAENGRESWLEEEMAVLADPATYQTDPEEAWRRLRLRSRNGRYLGVLIELAAWREQEAQRRDLPRNHVLRDEAIQELAAERPDSIGAIAKLRAVSRGVAEGALGQAILAAVRQGAEVRSGNLPAIERQEQLPRGLGPLIDLLKVLLRMRCEEYGVASKLVASAADLERIAADDNASVAALSGWRRELFGEHALALKHGIIGLAANGKRLQLIPLESAPGRRHGPPRQGKAAQPAPGPGR